MSRPQVGVQLIIFGRRFEQDRSGVLAQVAKAGYAGIEAGAPGGPEEVERLRAAVAGAGLVYAGGHCGVHQLSDPEVVEALATSVSALGGRFLLVSGRFENLDGYREGARVLSRAGARCRDAGVTLCYHNHAWEFQPIEGRRPIDLLIAESDPEAVRLCPDIYWIQVGGQAPADFIAQHRDRCPYFHFKDGLGGERAGEFRELGRGAVDVPSALQAALACSPEWIVTEQDSTEGDPADSVRISRECLRELGL